MVEHYIPLSGSYLESIKNFLNLERKKKSDLREVVGALRYIVRFGFSSECGQHVILNGKTRTTISANGQESGLFFDLCEESEF